MGATAAIGVMSMASAYSSSEATRAQGSYQKTMANINARNLDRAADDALVRGENDAKNYRKKVKQVVGSQRANFAAQGIDVSSGSALDIQTETREMGYMDALTIKNNAYREAMGFKQQAITQRFDGANAKWAANQSADMTLVAGGMQAASYGVQRMPSKAKG